MSVINISSHENFEELIRTTSVVVVHFFAPWAAQCEAMDVVIEELRKHTENQNVSFGKCEAENLPNVALKYKIEAVPTILLFKNGNEAGRINGANAAELTAKLSEVTGSSGVDNQSKSRLLPLNDRLKELVKKSIVMVFMKGNPQQPRCGFSRTLVNILNESSVPYETFDILEDEEVRQGLKTFSNWPTYPQIYVNGDLIGGLDIIKELKETGELISTLKGNS